jgi:Holliday junction resolvasome RuvABC endonuclease subunit
MQKRAVIGLDVSLVSTGVAIRTSDGSAVRVTAVSTPKKSAPTDLCRQRSILARVSEILDELEEYDRHVFFEDYAFSSFTGKAFTRAELVGMLMLRAAEAGCAVYTVGISALKRYISGKGNASKEEMCAAAASRWGFVYSGVGKKKDDIVDAFCLTCLGEGYLSSPGALTGVAQSCPPTTAPSALLGAAASARLGEVPMTVLTKRGWDELCVDMVSPPEPNEGLKRLFAYGKAWLESTGQI